MRDDQSLCGFTSHIDQISEVCKCHCCKSTPTHVGASSETRAIWTVSWPSLSSTSTSSGHRGTAAVVAVEAGVVIVAVMAATEVAEVGAGGSLSALVTRSRSSAGTGNSP